MSCVSSTIGQATKLRSVSGTCAIATLAATLAASSSRLAGAFRLFFMQTGCIMSMASKNAQEIHEIGFFLVRHFHVEAQVVELHDVRQGLCRAVREVGRARGD